MHAFGKRVGGEAASARVASARGGSGWLGVARGGLGWLGMARDGSGSAGWLGVAQDGSECTRNGSRHISHVAYGLWCAVRRCSSATRLC
eukprot:1373223-Prymnesium_polylepis.1